MVKPLIDTSLFFNRNTSLDAKGTIQQILGVQIMIDCERYLDLLMTGGKSKVNTFCDLQEKITKCVMGWKKKYISKARREVLIQTVA